MSGLSTVGWSLSGAWEATVASEFGGSRGKGKPWDCSFVRPVSHIPLPSMGHAGAPLGPEHDQLQQLFICTRLFPLKAECENSCSQSINAYDAHLDPIGLRTCHMDASSAHGPRSTHLGRDLKVPSGLVRIPSLHTSKA